ncbi:helix-turn-helix transcriptional regulator [Novosphingobium sp. 9]|uniref:helix-turn-helix transcriptional regulator n=1 Tax=Novosphingobium sp. 9 TaxID=2025349 RepID=UPI0021B644FE|nr:helix-turn-helix transcriptional regulator [Novosphingobium sp. 9]
MTSDEQRYLLGAFVRARREKVAAPSGARRRRTPGLRREELAERAGIGTTWLAWIEQGREIRPSAEALGRLAEGLNLAPAERRYLFSLAERHDPAHPPSLGSDAPPALEALVRALSCPAYALDPAWTVCCANRAARRLFAGLFDETETPNLLVYVFTHPAARNLLPDWRQRAIRVLGEFRRDFGLAIADPRVRFVVERLQESSLLFREGWADQAVREREGGRRTFIHPEDGAQHFLQHTVADIERGDFRLVYLEPEREAEMGGDQAGERAPG